MAIIYLLSPEEEAQEAALGSRLARSTTMGPMLMGFFIDALLTGFVVVQLLNWAAYSLKERMLTRICVAWCVTTTFLATIYNIVYIMHLFAYGFGIYSNFEDTNYYALYGIFTVFPVVGAQLFYVDRAIKLNGNSKIVGIICCLPVAGVIATSMGATVLLRQDRGATGEASEVAKALYNAWLVLTLAADVVITSFILWGLYKSKTGWQQTDYIIRRLLRVSLEAQLPSTAISLGFLMAFLIPEEPFYWLSFEFFFSKIYVVCLLSLLNSKVKLQRDYDSQGPGNVDHGRSIRAHHVMVSTEVYTETHQLNELALPVARLKRKPTPDPLYEDNEESEIEIKFESSPFNSSSDLTGVDFTKSETAQT